VIHCGFLILKFFPDWTGALDHSRPGLLNCLGGLFHSIKEMVKFSSQDCTEMVPGTCPASAVEPDERGTGRSCEASNLDGEDQ